MGTEVFSTEFWKAVAPEAILVIGLVLIFVVPNLGNSKFRIPLTKVQIPWFLGGRRFKFTGSPAIPGMLAAATLFTALGMMVIETIDGKMDTTTVTSGETVLLQIDAFSRFFEIIFLAAILLAVMASLDRIPANTFEGKKTLDELYDNRRQADLYILMLTTAVGMCMVALAQDLFVLFVGLELASLATYVLVAFHKESKAGAEAGVKYFIVGSVASGIGLYGLSLLYLEYGSLQLDVLASDWDGSILATIGLGLVLVGFGFKVSAAPFHFAAPDAYAGANSPVAGILATASKAMGMIGLVRVLLVVALPDVDSDGSAIWLYTLATLSVVTMTWGNLAALGSTNPKRMLAYSSVAHAGYMMAALTAVGAWKWGEIEAPVEYAHAIVAAVLFHLFVLVAFKLGAFLVLGLLEMEGGASRLSALSGLARRDPLIGTAMFVFMLSLAGVPPLAGFMSKFLVVSGIVSASIGDLSGSVSFSDLHWIWWLALAMFINSAISVFYYLRIGVVMFLDVPEEGRRKPLPYGASIRMAIWICLVATIIIGLSGDTLIDMCYRAAESLNLG
ncbi:MAG: NADH-quinone oxidoreductase subunit N [Euryarchaeota archaeon]|jgi:proton-translocating NADH-quinone oxidoreductase chain N|nr:NADH-quinone oxidoreductase subunit N [Euryarchaeota archaeon]MBT4982455.1 NADH-quinone oxidoreductase subunit N [Euryarchaeota archaeon]MBT5183832.1 NADH-quinone oxidoreductase subunit N [Euryarchaeota archaeon]